MKIPLNKVREARELLYTKQPRWFNDRSNDEQLERLLNELLTIIFIRTKFVVTGIDKSA